MNHMFALCRSARAAAAQADAASKAVMGRSLHLPLAPATAPAIRSDGCTFTYGELQAHIASIAARLHAHGHVAGDRVGFLLPPTFGYAAAMYSIWRQRGIAVPLSLHQQGEELAYTLQDSGCSLVLADASLAERVSKACPDMPLQVFHGAALPPLASAPVPVIEPAPSADDDALIIYTSGTTGRPKVFQLLHCLLEHLANRLTP